MKKEDYINVLLDGYLNRKKFYHNHLLFSKKKVFEEFGITNHEFIKTSLKIVDQLIVQARLNYKELIEELQNNLKNAVNEENNAYYKKRLQEEALSAPYFTHNLRPSFNGFASDIFSIDDLSSIRSELLKVFEDNSEIETESIGSNIQKDYNNKVFNCVNSEALFRKYIDLYKQDIHYKAEFSFLFYAMHKFELVICNGAKFITELAKYDISIDAIDSRQAFTISNKKINLFKISYKLFFNTELPNN